MGKPLNQVKRFSDTKKWEDDVEWFSFPDDRMVLVRIIGDVEVLARHWIRTMSGKMFPAWCPRLNDEEEFDSTRPCPMHEDFEDKAQKVIVCNAIVRNLQERGDPEPIKGLMLSHVIINDLTQIAELIKGNPSDPEEGVDLAIKYSSKAVGNQKWSVQRGDSTPMTATEKKYRMYDFSKIIPQFSDPEVAQEYAKNMREAMARHKHYVIQELDVPRNARDPFKYFRGDVRGKPWNEFQDLVDYKNAEKGDDAADYRVKRTDAPGNREMTQRSLYEETETETKTKSEPDEPKRQEVEQEREQLPECFAQYDGTAKCARCPVRGRCISETDDDDDI